MKNVGSVVVGTRTGGQGKTLITQLLYGAAQATGRRLTLVSADSVDDGPAKAGSKLAAIIDGVHEVAVAPPMENVLQSGTAVLAHWDRLGEFLEAGDALIDLGANVLGSVCGWARTSKIGAMLQPVTIVLPVTCQAQSAADAVAVLADLVEIGEDLPVAHKVIVFNNVHGPVSTASGASFDELRRMITAGELSGCAIKRCVSEIWSQVEAEQLPLANVVSMAPEEIAARFKVGKFAAVRGRQMLAAWRHESMKALLGVVFPSVAADRNSVPSASAGGFGN